MVKIYPLTRKIDQRGMLIEILRNDDKYFKKFGQVHVVYIWAGEKRGGHYHKKQYDYFFLAYGKDVFIELEDMKTTKCAFLELKHYQLVRIPPYIKHTIHNKSNEDIILIEITTIPYNQRKPDSFYE